MASTDSLVERLREYGGEVLHAREGDEPPYSNDHECALAALEAADHLESLAEKGYAVVRRSDLAAVCSAVMREENWGRAEKAVSRMYAETGVTDDEAQ